jgi:hypothetical protein
MDGNAVMGTGPDGSRAGKHHLTLTPTLTAANSIGAR